jgi:hypothetical protein
MSLLVAGGYMLAMTHGAQGEPHQLAAATPTSEEIVPPDGGDTSLILRPVDQDYVPGVDSQFAVDLASKSYDLSTAKSIQPMLVLFTDPVYRPVDAKTGNPTGPPVFEDVPTWVVLAEGVCFARAGAVVFAGSGDAGAVSIAPCIESTLVFVVNADTGQYMEDLAFQE